MKSGFASLAPGANRRIVYHVDSLGRFGSKYAWMVFALFACLWLLADIEPETAETVNTMIGIGGIACVLWVIWRLMQYDR